MGYCFNKINNKVLKFDLIKDIEKIKFNHYVMRRENFARIKGDLKKGQFSLSIDIVSTDLKISTSKAHRIIKEFETLGIIRGVVKGNLVKGYSIYEYVVESYEGNYEEDFEVDNENGLKAEGIENTNVLKTLQLKNEIDNEEDFENSKKENIKRDLNKDNICSQVIDYLNKKTNKKFKSTTSKTKSLINARVREGFDINDFYSVIDIKSSQWLYCDMAKYLRPETLFSNKFESYLNEVVSNDSKVNSKDIDESNAGNECWDIDFDY